MKQIQIQSMSFVPIWSAFESASKDKNVIWMLRNTPIVGVGTNDNFLTFEEDELSKAYKTLEGNPVVLNLTGEEDDHATNSSLNVVGHVYNVKYHNGIAYGDIEVTEPEVGKKLERMDSKGVSEISGVSMGANVTPICSICKKDVRSCGHERGQFYNGKLCSAIATNITFDHVALTSFPAWNKARIKSVERVAASLKKKNVKGQIDSNNVDMFGEEVEDKIPTESPEKKIERLEAEILQMKKSSAELSKEVDEMKNSKVKAQDETNDKLTDEEKKKKKEEEEAQELTDEEKKKKKEEEEAQELTDEEKKKKEDEKKKKEKETAQDELTDEEKKKKKAEEEAEEEKETTPEEKKMPGTTTENVEVTETPSDLNDDENKDELKKETKISEIKARRLEMEVAIQKRQIRVLQLARKEELLKRLGENGIPSEEFAKSSIAEIEAAIKASQMVRDRVVASRRERYFGKSEDSRIPRYVNEHASRNDNSQELSSREHAVSRAKEVGSAFALQEAYEKEKARKRL